MPIYKYQIKRSDTVIDVGSFVYLNDENGTKVKIITIIRIDTDEMILYFHGVLASELGEED